MTDTEKQIIEALDAVNTNGTELALNVVTLKHYTEGLAELIINHIAQGDQEQKNLLYLQLEQNKERSKRGEL